MRPPAISNAVEAATSTATRAVRARRTVGRSVPLRPSPRRLSARRAGRAPTIGSHATAKTTKKPIPPIQSKTADQYCLAKQQPCDLMRLSPQHHANRGFLLPPKRPQEHEHHDIGDHDE